MELDLDRVRENVRKATTEDLLDRATVYRSAMDPMALPLVLEELKTRGLTPEAIVAHEESLGEVLRDARSAAQKCSKCQRPAVRVEWGWHRMFGKLPLFPRVFRHCEEHRRS